MLQRGARPLTAAGGIAPRSRASLRAAPRRATAVLLCALASASSCGRRDSVDYPPPDIALIDAAPSGGVEEVLLHGVQVTFGGITDTVPGVRTATLPVVLPDGAVTGIRWDDDVPAAGFIYEPSTRLLQPVPLPDTPAAYAISPDGRHIAYTTWHRDGVTALVRRWPGGDVVFRGARAAGYPSGVVYDDVEWLDAVQVRITQRLDHFAMRVGGDYRTEVYQRMSGSVRTGRFSTDTVTVIHEP